MPLSAYSPDGPVTLVGMDILTVERLRDRNRKERLFTAKCCGAPVQIRTANGKVPHFYHLTVPDSCDGDKRETAEHVQIKHAIAVACKRAGWNVDTEVSEREPISNRLLWRADVLAWKDKIKIAFEVQLSKPDWNEMMERQMRYAKSNVRGLWFVRTKKEFPMSRELPIFALDERKEIRCVRMSNRSDFSLNWEDVANEGYIPLGEFVPGALSGRLKWAPMLSKRDLDIDARVYCNIHWECTNCGWREGWGYIVHASVADAQHYPTYFWTRSFPVKRRTYWVDGIMEKVGQLNRVGFGGSIMRASTVCRACGTTGEHLAPGKGVTLKACVRLQGISGARYGTLEWEWLHQWSFGPSSV